MRVQSLCALALAGATACASGGSGSSSAPAPEQTLRVVGASSGENMVMTGSDASSTRVLASTVDQVWRALPVVLDSLGIPISTLDPVKHTIGNQGFATRHRLKNVPMSRYLDCGSAQLGPAADDYDINLTLLVDVKSAEGNGAAVTVTFEAAARPPNYAQAYSRCSSRGALEDKLFALLKTHLDR
ncbi:MAG: hypothetical protein ACREPM_19385 [Gemmatimonadaceae bacterium]